MTLDTRAEKTGCSRRLPPPPPKKKVLKKEKVLVKTGIFYIALLFQLNTVMRCLFMLKLKGVTLSAFYCNTGSLSKDGFERWTTGSESLCLLICLDASKLVLLSVFTLIETNCSKICLKSPLKSAKSPFPKVDVRRSKDSNHDSDGNRNIKTTTLRVLEQAFSNISLGHSVRTTTTGNSFMRRFMEVVRS